MKKTKKKLKTTLANMLLYTIVWGMWTSFIIFGFTQNTIYQEEEMDIYNYLKDELKRFNRMNDLLEKKINKNEAISNEPEQIICNVIAMCEIATTIYKYNQT